VFELSIAWRYLLPRRRQLSLSIIALVSVLVISLVVWLILVFFSVTHGIEKRWLDSFVTFNAPLQLKPTEEYFRSYYHQIDRYAANSGYEYKTIGEKLKAAQTDPYDPAFDAELPRGLMPPDLRSDGSLKDLAGDAFAAIQGLQGFSGIAIRDFEVTLSSLNLDLLRKTWPLGALEKQRVLNQLSYLGAFDGQNRRLAKRINPISGADFSNLLALISRHPSPNQWHRLFDHAKVLSLKVPDEGWQLPVALPNGLHTEALGLYLGSRLSHVVLNGDLEQWTKKGWHAVYGQLSVADGQLHFAPNDQRPTQGEPLLLLQPGTFLPARLVEASVDSSQLLFDVDLALGERTLSLRIPYTGLEVGKVETRHAFTEEPLHSPPWVYSVNGEQRLPTDPELGEGIILCSLFRENGAALGDIGHLGYYAAGASAVQEHQLPIYVAGFYDPGFMPVGNKLVMVDQGITTLIRGSMNQLDPSEGNGLQVWIDDLNQIDAFKESVIAALEKAGIDRYWKVESFKEYDFSRALVEQFQSDRVLFSIISTIIIAVACSNIISMLILLVNDKKREIGVLMAMGARGRSIAFIFGFCGLFLGAISCLLGIVGALWTLNHLDLVVRGLSLLQGHQAFNPVFFGSSLPNELSVHALIFALSVTVTISVIAGLIPAIKASLVRPSTILRSE
jgi:lipoprotein-releasing system permease protein